ncbi:MAG: sugar-binding protein [candidate division KSB1 bacterium]|nr:sugar-binding protein [candidate division KSB1 bacterium]
MKVAIPISGSLFVFLGGLLTSVLSFHKIKSLFHKEKTSIVLISFLSIVFFIGLGVMVSSTSQPGYAEYITIQQQPNIPMGNAQGYYPGRVVWIHNADATNEELTNQAICDGDGWFKPEHNDQGVVDDMLSKAVKEITGETDIVRAWDKIFKINNAKRGKGDIGYQFDQDEKIFIKVNRTSAWGMGGWNANISDDFTRGQNTYFGTSETSPQLILSLLRHLVNEVGIDQANIYVGDPMKHLYKADLDLWLPEFPDIHVLDHHRTDAGRETVETGDSAIYYSDRGSVLRTGTWTNMGDGDPVYQDYFYKIFEDCEYLINVPTLKGHRRAGVTMFAKNHFGSHTRDGAKHLHMGLVCPDEPGRIPENERYDYGMYRVQVDLMGWEFIRKKALIYLMDALWSAGHEVIQPSKWKTAPFNHDWSSSIFISQDQVAIESVGYDFLRNEYTRERHPDLSYAQMQGADDYLHQAADSANWPEGLISDPENDGTPISSLGVHEHWNNPVDKQYSEISGLDSGIELVTRDASNDTQDDTVLVHHVTDVPVIDGNADDACWRQTDWQEIGQTWMPYDAFVLSDDFNGRYKCIWNSDSNRVYFLVDIKDDVLVDGYEVGDGGYYKYDVLELFVDEDYSGGLHQQGQGAQNSENAFAYHMNVNFPGDGNTTHELVAMDQYEWNQTVNYSDHFPEFAVKQYSHKNIYEFSLKMYSDDFDIDQPEASRVNLTENKMIGFSMAYCDNDDPDESPKTRDHFFGSVTVAHQDSNNHWINADHFGTIMLVDTAQTVAVADRNSQHIISDYSLIQNYPNPFNPVTQIQYTLPKSSQVHIAVYDMTGRKVATLVDETQNAGTHSINWDASGLASGVYFYKMTAGLYSAVKKCTLIK